MVVLRLFLNGYDQERCKFNCTDENEMTKEKFSNKAPDITGEACGWVAQLETGNMSREDFTALKEWMGRSPQHINEIHKMALLSDDMNVLIEMADSINAAAKKNSSAVSQSSGGFAVKWYSAFTACVLVLFAGVSYFLVDSSQDPKAPLILATDIGGFEEITLADNSIVKLNTNSQIEVDFDKSQRRIRLLKGEAIFKVAHNPARPFIVYVDDKFVKAVGTAFAVRWTDGDLSVTVSEGRVAFAPVVVKPYQNLAGEVEQVKTHQVLANINAKKPLFLDSGQKLVLSKSVEPTLVAAVTARELKSEMSWQDGILDFSPQPLIEIIDEINRYTNVRIEITDPNLSQLKFGGIFRTGETKALFDALELAFDVEVEYVSERYVRIRMTEG